MISAPLSTNLVPGWDDSDGGGWDCATRPSYGTGDKYLRLRSGKMATKSAIDTTGLVNIHLEYDWGQDADNDGSDDGDMVVQWKLSAAGNWTTVNTHDLASDITTRPATHVDAALGVTAEDTSTESETGEIPMKTLTAHGWTMSLSAATR